MPVSRRALLGMAALLPLAGCATETEPAPPPASTKSSTPQAVIENPEALAQLEQKFGARLGLYATGTAGTIVHRADERFAFCSTFKGLAAAAVLHRNPLSHLDTKVTYTRDDLMRSSVVTESHVDTGMTVGQLCDAAVRYSDGTAGNLLLRDLGGPAELTAYTRDLGDTVTRMDRIEPDIVEATPGDPRDTSTPRALGTDYQKIVLGDALPADKRAVIRDLLERNTTGANRIRAALPTGWTMANKTGTGDYATANDIAILFPPDADPILLAIMSSKDTADAEYDEALIAEATAYVLGIL